ncbi:MAG: flagellar basal body L-ring protein FlgH [Vampirovibrionales bacterium]|nr:flagellar basal body L-ring protein FlgH [Vampirovibrionales bacterium]
MSQSTECFSAQAESLFRATATTYAKTGEPEYRPASLIGPPIAHNVGDTVTIRFDQQSRNEVEVNNRITKQQAITDTGTAITNGNIRFLLDKIPFINTSKLADTLSLPSFDGLNNANNITAKVTTQNRTLMDDRVTCQVVQILPNGFLMVQGKKTSFMNKERQDIFVTGVVNPFYLDNLNEVNSQYVASLQYMAGGKGVASRQQNDGLASKLYQFLN